MHNDNIRKHLKITGRVQGVGYRYFTRQNAEDLNLKGWVKNMPDGSVETVLSGRSDDVEEMIERLWKGPYSAQVKNIEQLKMETEPEGDYQYFRVKR